MNTESGIRRASKSDLSAIIEVERACEEAPHWTADQYEDFLQVTSNSVHRKAAFVIEEGQRVVGFSAVSFVAGEAELESVAVLPEFRRRGLGSRLYGAIVEWANENQAEKIWLEVRVANRGAQALYKELGFVEVGARKNYYANPIDDAVLMAATLRR